MSILRTDLFASCGPANFGGWSTAIIPRVDGRFIDDEPANVVLAGLSDGLDEK
jgi:hypothetical protein